MSWSLLRKGKALSDDPGKKEAKWKIGRPFHFLFSVLCFFD